jgi:hypothetical protein
MFTYVRKPAVRRLKISQSVRLSAPYHETTLKPVNGFLWNLVSEGFDNIFPAPVLVKSNKNNVDTLHWAFSKILVFNGGCYVYIF